MTPPVSPSPAGAPAPGASADEPGALAPDVPRLPLATIALYSMPAVGVGYMFLLVTLFLLKYATDVLLIAPAAMGAIFMAGRIWDALTDPLAGYLSDRTRTRFGRRRPWMAVAAIPIGATFVMLWLPPAGLEGGARLAWMAAAVLLFYTATTALLVPHHSLGAELTTHYHDRTRVFGVRQIAWHVGVFFSLVSMGILTASEAPQRLAGWQALLAAGVTTALVLLAVRGLRERSDFQGRGARSPYRAFGDVWRNPHARLLLFVFFIESTGGAVVGVLTIYFSEYVLGTPSLTPFYIGSYFVAATLSVPLWIHLSRRVGKKNLWLASMVATALGFGSTFLLGPGDAWPLIGIALVLGLAAGCGNIVGPSIQADIIDYDEYRTGERKEGAYFAAWNFVFKMATGITLGITGFALQAAGFEPNVEQSPQAKLAIRGLYALFPLGCYAIGSLLFLRFAFNEAQYAVVRREIDARGKPGG